jgi:hypothetical protein
VSADCRPDMGELPLAGQEQPAPTARDRKIAVLRHFHSLGYGLRDIVHPLRMGGKLADLLRLARLAGLVFPDTLEVAAEVVREGRLEK